MDERLPSLTALAVAFARAAYTEAPYALRAASDPVARRLLPLGVAQLAAAMPLAWRVPAFTQRALHLLGMGFLDHVALRTAAIDSALESAIDRGVHQLVILGAGLDARAWRLDSLAQCNVFEVDHPATQGYKRRHVEALTPRARGVRFVSVDFEREAPGDRLAVSGHDPTVRSFWLWEGVTPYLNVSAIEATLAMIRGRSIAGSMLAVSYVTPDLLSIGRGMEPLLREGARLIREPLRGVMRTDELHALIERHGFEVQSDTDTLDWAARFWPAREARMIEARERLLVARVPPPYTSTP